MNIDMIRADFDLWFITNAPQCAALALAGDKLRIAMREMAWFSWQASRAAVALDLPRYNVNPAGDWEPDKEGDSLWFPEVNAALQAQGLKVRP